MKTAENKFMWATTVPTSRTMAEISTALVQAGARQIATTYGEKGEVNGLCFTLPVDGMFLPFKLPARTEALFTKINGQRKRQRTEHANEDRSQAERVGWRQLLRWVEAQLALTQTGMASSHEVFLPYMQDQSGRTLFESMAANRFKALTASKPARTAIAGGRQVQTEPRLALPGS